MATANRNLFNFAASPIGGGYKRLYEFSRVFDKREGACFLAHEACRGIEREFPGNRYFFVSQPQYKRLLWDGGYLKPILGEIGIPELYFAYGMPIYERIGAVNWFHLSNVLALGTRGIPLPMFFRLKMNILGWKVRRNYRNADVVSAESRSSLDLIDASQKEKFFVSVNGSDDELEQAAASDPERENIAVAVGTYRYKAISDAYAAFEMLRRSNPSLQLVIIGKETDIPSSVRVQPGTRLLGSIHRSEVMRWLRKARYYISATLVENSYNAASEGVFLAETSIISDIGPHRELLRDIPHERITVSGISRQLLRVERKNASTTRLKSWEQVVDDVMDRVASELGRKGAFENSRHALDV